MADKKAAIGYVYEDSTPVNSVPSSSVTPAICDDEDKDDDSDIDLGELNITRIVMKCFIRKSRPRVRLPAYEE